MKNIYIILILFLSFTIISCAKKSDTSSTTTPPTTTTTTTTELEGTWETACVSSGSYYIINTITVTGTDVVQKSAAHSDSSCATDYDTYTTTYSSLAIGDAYTFSTYGSSGGSGHRLTMTLSDVTYTPHTTGTVSWDNTNSYCGLTGWELNTAQSIAGKTCSGSTYYSAGQAYYGLYILDDTYLMPNISGSGYPTTVSWPTSNVFVKQ